MMSRDALVVGINNYKEDNLRNLNAPAKDAEAIAQILEEYGEFNVWRLPEAIDKNTRKPFIAKTVELSLTQLQKALVKLFKPEGRQVPDTALFYFSGHGLRQDLGIQEGFIATSDVSPGLGFNGLSLQWLRRLLQESPVKQQIIWLDCCHSGEILNFNEADPGEQGQARDRCFIAASREFESSFEDLNSRYSVLTKILLDGINPERCPQQWITNYSLVDFINQNLRHENQRPVFSNFGSPIHLTRTLDTPIPVSKGANSEDICPYKGLEYFDFNESDPKYFYGREKLTDVLLDRIRQGNFLAILGASGSGKSSVLRAGLLHQLKLGRKLAGSEDWKIQIMFPWEHPLQSLALSWLEPNLSDAQRAIQLDQIESLLKQGGEGLRKLVQASTSNRVILVIDQFEEAFTLCQDLEEREAFFKCLLEALEQTDSKLCLILAMRIDFFGKCFERKYSGLGNKIQDKDNFIAIPPMKREELKQAIIKPAEKVNLSLESGLAEEILKDIKSSPGSLPLLQDTLTELWKRRKDNQLKFTAYSQLGGIGGTLNRRATQVYNSLNQEEQDVVQHIFLSLTNLGEESEDTRRRVLKQDLITVKYDEQLIDRVVQKLANEKLIVIRDRVEKDLKIGKQAEVDVAHEALIRNWIIVRQWLLKSRALLRENRRIELSALAWRDQGKNDGYLLQEIPLAEARRFQKEKAQQFPLSSLAVEFIQLSVRNRNRNRFRLAAWFIIPLALLLGVAEYFLREDTIKRNYANLRSSNLIEIRQAIIYLTKGCGKHSTWLPIYIDKRIFGNCHPLNNISLQGSKLGNIYLGNINLSGSNLRGSNLSGDIFINTDFIGANLNGANLSRANLRNTDLRVAKLRGSNLSGANLNGANLNGANLNGANLTGANLTGANLNSAALYGTNLIGANLLNSQGLNEQSLKYGKLCNTKLPEFINLNPDRDCF